MDANITRVVALGASNLTRGFETVVSSARTAWGREVEVLGALGHGRSYGVESRLIVRTLPGILQSGLWDTLASLPPAATRGLVTDIGNDILYEFPAPTILEWVEEAVDRLHKRHRRYRAHRSAAAHHPRSLDAGIPGVPIDFCAALPAVARSTSSTGWSR